MQQYYSMMGFLSFVGIHQSCNYIALRSVALHHFNRQRLSIVLQNYSHQYHQSTDASKKSTIAMVLSSAQVAEQEYFLPKLFYPFRSNDVGDDWLTIGCTLPSICPKGIEQLMQLRNACRNENYIVNVEGNGKGKCNHRIQLVFLEQATSTDIIRGMFHAHVLYQLVKEKHHIGVADDIDNDTDDHNHHVLQVISKSHQCVESVIPSLMQQLHHVGWNTQTVFVEEEPISFRFMIPELPNNLQIWAQRDVYG